MVISDIVMTIGVGISQKKKMKNLTPVTILWFDPYTNCLLEIKLYNMILKLISMKGFSIFQTRLPIKLVFFKFCDCLLYM